MVILRCCAAEEFYLERVAFPFELLSFQCPADSVVEIWTHGLGGPELLESLRALELVVDAAPVMSAVPDSTPLCGSHSPWLEAG
jgi:hypothetical protein